MNATSRDHLVDAHQSSAEEVAAELAVRPDPGLSEVEARRRLVEHGPNRFRVESSPGIWRLLLRQLWSPLIVLLLVAAAIASSIGDPKDAAVILAIVVLNAIIGTVQESRAEHALASLRALTPLTASVRRDGAVREIAAEDLVPGDVVLLAEGDVIPADGRLWTTVSFRVDESTLTGESVPVDKSADVVLAAETLLPDRVNMAFAGTATTAGRAEMLVTLTGETTQVGRLARIAAQSGPQITPLERHVAWLGKVLSVLALFASAAVFLLGLMRGWPLEQMALVALSLAVAAVPEGLPAVVTVVLALGVQRMARRNAIVRRLASVEALGSATVICTDKTGTLTRGEMEATSVIAGRQTLEVHADEIRRDGGRVGDQLSPDLEELLLAAVLCNDARLEPTPTGDPTERALLLLGRRLGADQRELQADWPRTAEVPFSSDRRWMATVHVRDGEAKAYVKGAPDVVLRHCSAELIDGAAGPLTDERRHQVDSAMTELTASGLRVLALASRGLPDLPCNTQPAEKWLDSDLVLLGLIGLLDTPRPEARDAIKACHTAGIRVIMITGDHPETASAIAARLDLESDQVITGSWLDRAAPAELAEAVIRRSVFARVAPHQKVDIVRALQAGGEVVAMTGDGANDAPALRLADIGVAMGLRGTAVAKEAADIVLADDNFATIAAAVEEGRTIYANLRNTVFYLVSGNFGEILVIFVAMIVGLPLPLLPIHILWINLVTDALPALGLGMEPRDHDAMARPPRPTNERFLPAWSMPLIVVPGALLALVTLVTFATVSLGAGDLGTAQTAAFAALILAHLGIAWANRSSHIASHRLPLASNPLLLIAMGFGVLSLLVLVFWEPARFVFHTTSLNLRTWALILAVAPLPFIGAELVKLFNRRK